MMKVMCAKMAAVLLFCGILFGCADNGNGRSEDAGQTQFPSNGNTGSSERIVLHVYDYINVYTWGTDNETLNGVHSYLSSEGQGWYGITLNTGYACIIFTMEYDGWAGQTDDLERPSGEWWYQDGQWYSSKPNTESSSGGNTGGNSGGSGGGNASGGSSSGVWSSNIYLEIMAFSYTPNDFNNGTFVKLDSSTTEEFKRKLNTNYKMVTGGSTKLYYCFDKALTNLSNYSFPNNLKAINIITFTDGLDLASSSSPLDGKEFASNEEYGEWIKNKIDTISISGLKLNCYSVGVQGNDIEGKTELFEKSLSNITSNDNTPYIKDNITQVAEAFSSIADGLVVRQTLYDLTLEVPFGATTVRMVFDGVNGMSSADALYSNLYLEGTIEGTKNKTIKITAHPGLILETEKVLGEPIYDKDGIDTGNYSYKLKNMKFTVPVDDDVLKQPKSQQFIKEGSSNSFTINSEYVASDHCETKKDEYSTAIYLILDATSSLGENGVKAVQNAAIEFVDKLAEKAQADN